MSNNEKQGILKEESIENRDKDNKRIEEINKELEKNEKTINQNKTSIETNKQTIEINETIKEDANFNLRALKKVRAEKVEKDDTHRSANVNGIGQAQEKSQGMSIGGK